ncbi:MAG: methylglyoxal synthase [Oscillospiraceae bacterium]|nr:methylglyoxal synthase [Oscillospiraceae bacterium]
MNIALIAHDRKKEMLVQFCIAYSKTFSQYSLCATATTGRLITEATGLSISCVSSGVQGQEQIGARIPYNEIDLVIFFRDPLSSPPHERGMELIRLCDLHSIPIATNIATAEVLIQGLMRGDLNWRNIMTST